MSLLASKVHLNSSCIKSKTSRKQVQARALFNWGKKDVQKSQKELDKEEMYRQQQEMLAARRSGTALQEANQRRAKVAETLAARKAARRAEREALARGEMPETLKDWRNYANKEDEKATSGLVVPLLPFGMPKYDAGERFDLRSPYADDGWVDPEETDAFAGLKRIGEKLLNFSGRRTKQETKPIIWASQYDKYVADQKAAKKQQKK